VRILVQWTQRDPRDYVALDSAAWAALARRPEPAPGQLGGQDNVPGWVMTLNVQGVHFEGHDHYALEDQPDGSLRVWHWLDDPVDLIARGETAFGRVWTFWPPEHDPLLHGRLIDKVVEIRERMAAGRVATAPITLRAGRVIAHQSEVTADDAVNTRQSVVTYTDTPAIHAISSDTRPWAEFPFPPDAITRHGVWVDEPTLAEHVAVRTEHGWREWVGPVQGAPQFLPHSTITYYGSNTALAAGWMTATNEEAALTTTSGGATLTESWTGSSTHTSFGWSSPSSEPNVADWPSGVFHLQIDVSVMGADMLLQNDSAAAFSNVSSDLATTNSTPGTLANWDSTSGTGVKLNTSATWDAAAGAASDRYGVLVRVSQTNSHKSETITIQNVNTTTCYLDGPWTGSVSTTITGVSATATAAVSIPTITGVQIASATVSAPAAAATAAVSLPTITGQVQTSIVAVPAEAPASVPVPTISTVRNAVISAVPAEATAAVPLPTVTGVQVASATVSAIPAEASAAVPTPTVTAQVQATVAAVAATADAAVPTPVIASAQIANVAAVPAVATASVPLPTITGETGGVSATVSAVPAEAPAEVPLPAISTVRNAVILAVPAEAAAEVPPPAITAQVQATVLAVAATADAAVPLPTITAQVQATVSAPAATAAAAVPVPAIATAQIAAVTAPPAEAIAEVLTPTITAGSTVDATILAVPAEATAEVPLPVITALDLAQPVPAVGGGYRQGTWLQPRPPGRVISSGLVIEIIVDVVATGALVRGPRPRLPAEVLVATPRTSNAPRIPTRIISAGLVTVIDIGVSVGAVRVEDTNDPDELWFLGLGETE
jgi:hypothetical protein